VPFVRDGLFAVPDWDVITNARTRRPSAHQEEG
jgi:hypothetical protein